MELLYRGFDGLDLSFKGHISPELCTELEAAKEHAQQSHSPAVVFCGGLKMEVSESGARGGYAFIASTGRFGATWFFKKPNARDPWGVRVSCASFNLALNGLGGARAELYATLEQLGVAVAGESESLGRIDYAMDFLAPDFVLVPEHFVMHSNASWADHSEQLPDVSVHGRSGRVTSVTVGKMPGRQVIVYDKRAEVIARQKVGWWEIWDAARARSGQPPLIRDDGAESRVWRVELRAGKQHLKERWNIRTWAELDRRFGDLVAASLDAIRHAQPTGDSNRSRWPESELWQNVREGAEADLFEMRSWADPDLVKRVEKEAYEDMLTTHMKGLLIARAALNGTQAKTLPAFARAVGAEMAEDFARAPRRFEQKLALARDRYSLGIEQEGNRWADQATSDGSSPW